MESSVDLTCSALVGRRGVWGGEEIKADKESACVYLSVTPAVLPDFDDATHPV